MKYKIGEFSRISMFSVRTLRYYHEIELIVPEYTDEDTGYRYYNETNYKRARLINLLKEFEFSINEIKEIVAEYEDESDLKYYLSEKNEMIQKKINHYKQLQKKMQAFETFEEVEHMKNIVINELEIEDLLVASLTYVGKYEDVGDYLGKLFKAVKMNVAGKPFTIYHDDDYKEENATVEVCIPIKQKIEYKTVECKVITGGKGLSIMHIGPYDTLSSSYKYLTDYIIENKLEPLSHIREHYHKGPGMLLKGNPEKYRTEIQIIIK